MSQVASESMLSRSPAMPVYAQRVLRAWGVAVVLGLGAIGTLHLAADRLPHPQPLEELSYYPSGEHLEPATLGHAESAADLAWLRAVQYYGGYRFGTNDLHRMDHVFDILTSLSPGFEPAYVFGAFAMAQEGQSFGKAEGLMLKGLAANPRSGTLAFQLGFLYYVRPGGRDLRHAAEYFEQAARMSDAPPQAAHFAAFARQNAGDLRVAYELWADVRAHSPNRYLREIAEREMNSIRDAIATGESARAVRKLAVPRVILGGH